MCIWHPRTLHNPDIAPPPVDFILETVHSLIIPLTPLSFHFLSFSSSSPTPRIWIQEYVAVRLHSKKRKTQKKPAYFHGRWRYWVSSTWAYPITSFQNLFPFSPFLPRSYHYLILASPSLPPSSLPKRRQHVSWRKHRKGQHGG